MNDLDRKLNALCDAFPFRAGYFFKDLETGLVLGRNADTIYNSASLRKISILMAALAMVRRGELSLDQPLAVEARHRENESGVLRHLSAGPTLSLRDALMLMIIVSDSTAAGMVSDLVSLDEINAWCGRAGLAKTLHRFGTTPKDYSPASAKNLTTARDVGMLLEKILKGSEDPLAAKQLEATPGLCGMAMEMLCAQEIRNRLPALLPAGTRVAHKTGLDFDCVHDAGIIYDPCGRPLFLLAVLVDRVPDELPDKRPGKAVAMHLIARMGRLCFDALIVDAPKEALIHAQPA